MEAVQSSMRRSLLYFDTSLFYARKLWRFRKRSLADVAAPVGARPALTCSLSLASDDRSSHDSLWGRSAAGSDPATDGAGGGCAPAPLGPPVPAETDGIGGRATGVVTTSEGPCVLEQGRSPVEEAGQEEEGAEDEELGSGVEEGEEAAVALGALSWLPGDREEGGNSRPEGAGVAEATATRPAEALCR